LKGEEEIEPKARGLAFIYTRTFLVEKLGEKGFEKFVKSLPLHLQNFLIGEITDSLMYPYEYLSDLNKEILEKVGKGDMRIIRELGRYSIKRGRNGPFSSLFKTSDFKTYITQIGTFTFRHYYNFGDFSVKEFEPENKRVVIQLKNLPFKDELFEERIAGAIYAAAEIRGLKNPRLKITKRISRGDNVVEYLLTWE